MQEDINPNPAMPQAPVEAVSVDPNLTTQVPVVEAPSVVPPAENVSVAPSADFSPQVPQSQDKSDAMTYPLGSQDNQPEPDPVAPIPTEDHRSILERIMGKFSKSKKDESGNTQPGSENQPLVNPTPPLSQ